MVPTRKIDCRLLFEESEWKVKGMKFPKAGEGERKEKRRMLLP